MRPLFFTSQQLSFGTRKRPLLFLAVIPFHYIKLVQIILYSDYFVNQSYSFNSDKSLLTHWFKFV